ncbi:radial spoke head 10 homolog B-like isoform X2 [Belonocnema kinseyi]|uniref:radial spoke head 10 homolog B-like isoform X2 n=1 Tax=Belonocnema kinseyi TaxID=2817044 RepID=UPI00143CED4D|nr:radial spoke head 10 homolog B-like isoform X2 [Belonocnema kinseyi]
MNVPFETEIKDDEKNLQEDKIDYYQSNAQEKLINLLYNDILKNFITDQSWNIIPSNANVCVNKQPDSLITNEEIIDGELDKTNNKEEMPGLEKHSHEKKDEKHVFQDDKYEITFPNGNSYSGQINRNKIDGVGSYFWRYGAQYKGEFKENRIEGKGNLIWKDNSWYEGEFLNSMRHGKGIMVNKDFSRFYTGNWYMGQKNGKGLCRYSDDNFYDGNWVMGKKNGMGYRVYPNGSVYMGNWENDFRHGVGTMVWPNGDIYRGEWVSGKMHGYGEYTWNGYFNKTLSWPQENSYMGQWSCGLRHGKGLLKLNSAGGAKYSGMWNADKKHGFGVLIGNDGSVLERNPLFQNDILVSENIETNESEENLEYQKETKFIKEPKKIVDPIETSLLNPEQWPLLSQFMRHLLIKPKNEIDDTVLEVQRCEECNLEVKEPCNCLKDVLKKELKTRSSVENTIDYNIKLKEKLLSQEEMLLRNSLTTHMPRLKQIYETYTKVFCPNEKVSPYLSMSRLSLWQLWRDCGIHKKNISLIEIDNLLASSSAKHLVETERGPFERIEIWQFLYALLELSWQLYSRFENSGYSENRLAGGFCKLLELDIFPNAGNHCDSPLQNPASSIPSRIFEGKNVNTVGERITFIPNPEPLINSNSPNSNESAKNLDISVFRELGPTQFLLIVAIVCPSIKNVELNIIVNTNYELTFLEFYELLLEATAVLIKKRKMKEQKRLQVMQNQKSNEIGIETVSVTSLSTRVESHSSISIKKGEKLKKKKQRN